MSVDLRQKSATYRVEVKLLSPLHVGSGRKLLKDVDWVEHQSRVYVVDQDVLLEELLPEMEVELDATVVDYLVGMKLSDVVGELQRSGHLNWDGPCFRYSLPGRPVGRMPQEIHEQIKDVYGWPYLPGSSLKGALRSLLARRVVKDEERQTQINHERDRRGGLNPRVAAKKIERNLFVTRTNGVNESNFDLWRTVQATDSTPVLDLDRLALARVDVYPPRASGKPRPQMNVEVLRTGTRLTATLKLDHTLFLPQAEERLRFGDRRRWLEGIAKRAQNDTAIRLTEEVEYYQAHNGFSQTLTFYARLVKMLVERELAEDEFLVQVGWGAGWISKTLGSVMRQQMGEDAFVKMANDFRLAWDRRRRRSKWVKNGLAPLTRRLATVDVDKERHVPLGWIRVKLEEVR